MINLYYLDISNADEDYNLIDFCSLRKDYLSTITDKRRFKQSYYVWKLLIHALKDLGVKQQIFVQNDNKWELVDGKYKFSLSHSKNIVCALISNDYCSVDVELLSPKIIKLANKLSSNTQNIVELTKIWTEKECFIKENNSKVYKHFSVSDLEGDEYDLCVGFLAPHKQIKINKIDYYNL